MSPHPDSRNASLSRNNSVTSQTMAIMQSSLSFKSLLSRQSTFWPSNQELLQKHPSFEFLNPSPDSELRIATPVSSIFNLVATVCGGGVLTLPIAFAKAGIIPATIMMILSAGITDFAMYILCSCARRTGGKSYGDVTRIAFGAKAEVSVTILLFVFLYFVIVAYMVLVKDIWTNLLIHLLPSLKELVRQYFNVDADTSPLPSDLFLVAFIIISLPLLLQKNLHALRHTCYVGFTSLILLIVAIVRRAYQLNFLDDTGIFEKKVKWYSTDVHDIIYAFPIIALSFFSIYNVLSVHSVLVNPTRERVKLVLDGTIGICLVLFYIVGLCGYLYAYDETKDNILLNFPLEYKIVLIGRLGYGFTLMFGLPLVFLPCREALLSIPSLIHDWYHGVEKIIDCPPTPMSMASVKSRKTGITREGHFVVNGVDFDEERPLLKRNLSIIPLEEALASGTLMPMNQMVAGDFAYGSVSTPIVPSVLPPLPSLQGLGGSTRSLLGPKTMSSGISMKETAFKPPVESITTEIKSVDNEKDLEQNDSEDDLTQDEEDVVYTPLWLHVLSTLVILGLAYICAVAVPGVGLVWSICGSSMSLIIGFFIPAACYLKIRIRKRINPRSIGAWSMAIFSIFASVICTSQIVSTMFEK